MTLGGRGEEGRGGGGGRGEEVGGCVGGGGGPKVFVAVGDLKRDSSSQT